jgi:hypothetical protein
MTIPSLRKEDPGGIGAIEWRMIKPKAANELGTSELETEGSIAFVRYPLIV